MDIILDIFLREGKVEKVQKREGLVVVCAECRKVIRTVGAVSPGGTPLISHGICPECAERLYGVIFRGQKKDPVPSSDNPAG